MTNVKRALSMFLCLLMVFSLFTIIPITSYEADAAVTSNDTAATTVSGQSVTVPNVWAARRDQQSGRTYAIAWPKDNSTVRVFNLNGSDPGYRDQSVIKGTVGMPYFIASDLSANEKWTLSADGGWYWRNQDNNRYLAWHYTGAISGVQDKYRISGVTSKPKNDGSLSGWYTFKDLDTVNVNTNESKLVYRANLYDKTMSFYNDTNTSYWTAINAQGSLKSKATSVYVFQKQDLNLSIDIQGSNQVIQGKTEQYKFAITDNLGGVTHTTVGTTKDASYVGYTFGSDRTVTWTSSNTAAATVSSSGVVTPKSDLKQSATTTITCTFSWTENGTNYSLSTSKTITVLSQPAHMGSSLSVSAWFALLPSEVTTNTTYIVTRAAQTTANSIKQQPALTTAGIGQQVTSTMLNVQVPLNSADRPYIKLSDSGTHTTYQWTIVNKKFSSLAQSENYWVWKNIANEGALCWYYQGTNGQDKDYLHTEKYSDVHSPIDNNVGNVATGVPKKGWYTFYHIGTTDSAISSAKQPSDYALYLCYDYTASVKKPNVDTGGKWYQHHNDDNLFSADQWLTIYAQKSITVSLDVTPASASGTAGMGTQQFTANRSTNYRYAGSTDYNWVSKCMN